VQQGENAVKVARKDLENPDVKVATKEGKKVATKEEKKVGVEDVVNLAFI
tara:strand:+ start:106 stop:255 length:150 start_codon:yes stop_codon:yes gene_type:complete